MKVTKYWIFSHINTSKETQKELPRGRPGGPSEAVIALPRGLTRLPRGSAGLLSRCPRARAQQNLPCKLLFELSISSDKETMSGCWRWLVYMKGTGCTTTGWMTGRMPGLRIPCLVSAAAITGGMDRGMLKGCTPGEGGEYFLMGGLEGGMLSTGDALRCDGNLREEGEPPAEGGEPRLFTVRSTGSIWIP